MGLCGFLGWGDVRDGKRRHHGPWNVSCDHFHVASSNSQNSMYFVRYLCSVYMFWGDESPEHLRW